MPVATTTAILAGGALLGGAMSSSAASKAAKAQRNAANQASQISKDQFAQTRADLAPYRDAGANALTRYADASGVNGADKRMASFADFRADPGYEFQMSEGLRGVQGSAAAGSLGINGGGVLKALQRYGQGVADQGYNNYLTRFQNLASLGQNAAAQTGNFGAAAAQQQGQFAMDAGAAKAGGYLGQANAWNGAINSGLKIAGRDPYFQNFGRG